MNNKVSDFMLRAYGEIHQRIDVEALRESEQASSTNWSELAEDPVFRGSISVIQAAYASAVKGAKGVLDESRILREQVESHLE
ncbi:MAG TPA: hypothetical protein VMQ83_07210 [Gammaproteobacteria bacterium]|nr:hypothetical protein [Gammaproteobacteria bacterium]